MYDGDNALVEGCVLHMFRAVLLLLFVVAYPLHRYNHGCIAMRQLTI